MASEHMASFLKWLEEEHNIPVSVTTEKWNEITDTKADSDSELSDSDSELSDSDSELVLFDTEPDDSDSAREEIIKKMKYWNFEVPKYEYMNNVKELRSYYFDCLGRKFDYLVADYVDESQIQELIDMDEWDFLSEYLCLSARFIENHHEKLNWHLVSDFQILPDDLIVKFIDKVDITQIIGGQHSLNREYIRKDVEELIYHKMIQKFESESTQQPNVGPFEHDAKRLYDYMLVQHPKPEKFKRRVQKRIRRQNCITAEDVCKDIKLYNDDFLDLRASLADDCYLNSAPILRYFELTEIDISGCK